VLIVKRDSRGHVNSSVSLLASIDTYSVASWIEGLWITRVPPLPPPPPSRRAIHHMRLFLALQTFLKVPSGHHMVVRVLLSALTAIVASLTRITLVKRPFRFILVFADDCHDPFWSYQNPMVYQGIPLVNLTECEIRSVLFGLDGRVEEWNLTTTHTRIASYLTPDTTRRCESIISLICHLQARASRARDRLVDS
jgi:hypothetical protein